MQFEENDKRIREAAAQHHPPYDDKAWSKMERLLDKEMPQEKKRRRPFILFFLLFTLLAGGLVVLWMQKPWQNNTTVAGNNSSIEKKGNITAPASKTIPAENEHTATTPATPLQKQDNTSQQENSKPVTTTNTATNNSTTSATPQKQYDATKPLLTNGAPKSNNPLKQQASSTYKKAAAKQDAVVNMMVNAAGTGKKQQPAKNDVVSNSTPSSAVDKNEAIKSTDVKPVTDVSKNKTDEAATADNTREDAIATDKKADTAATEKKEAVITDAGNKTAAKKKTKSSPLSKLGFTLSAGPDVSKAGSSTMGKVNMLYGAGISYDIGKFTIRTGVYGVKKVYQANASSYTLSYPLPWGTKFLGADASCKVMAVPVALAYNFGARKKHSWTVAAGASSYFMKKEVYDYHYKNAGGNYYTYTSHYSNKNKHYLSVLDLSAGYTLRVSKIMTVSTSPYIQIPVTGIGEGNVHLSSGGVLFTIGVKPFGKK